MGVLSWLGLANAVAASPQPAAFSVTSPNVGVVSPWAGPSHLAKVVIDDIFDVKVKPVTRAEAMTIPAVVKARHLICEMLARQPLRAYRDGVALEDQPTWLTRTDTGVSPRMRIVWTMDDLLFYGWSLWATKRGAEGQILDASRVPPDLWKFDANGNVLVADKPVNADQVVLIPGIFEGLLAPGSSTIRGTKDLENQWIARVKNPVPLTEIRYTGDEYLTDDEIKDIRDKFIVARNDPDGTVMVTPSGFEVHTSGDSTLELFTEGRNAAALDIARFANIPAILLDASNINATSINYSNGDTKRSEFLDITLRSWALSLEDRLSMDDCTPRGTTIAFDLSALRTPDTGTGPVLED